MGVVLFPTSEKNCFDPSKYYRAWQHLVLRHAESAYCLNSPGKRSGNPDDANWIPTIFQHTSARDIAKVENKIAKQARYETLKKKRGKFQTGKVTERVSSEEASSPCNSSSDGVMPPSNEENKEDDESILATSTIARLTTKVSQLEE